VARAETEAALAAIRRHWREGRRAEAERLCRALLAASPAEPEALHLLGLAAYGRGEIDAAIDCLAQACAAADAPALFLSNLAEVYRRQGRLAEAIAVGRRAIARDPTLAAAWNNLGIALHGEGALEESRAALLRAIELQPDFAGALSNLGNTLRRLGDLGGARARHEQAIALVPQSAELHSNLAATLLDLGRLDDALAAAARAAALDPQLVDAYLNAAAVESARERHAEALAWLARAAAVAPGRSDVQLARANALRRLDRPDEALAICADLLAREPGNGEAHNMRALALQALGRSEEALAGFARAADLQPRSGTAMANAALLLMQLGRRKAALERFDAALRIEPTLASAWLSRADAKTFAPGDPDIAAMAGLLEGGRVHGYQDRICLHFALGKACLDAGEAARAFAHFAEGNRMKRAVTAYDPAAAEAWLARIAAQFTPELLARFADAGPASPLPVFVIGMPRSGTTLVEQILASHPAIRGAGELPHLHAIAAELCSPALRERSADAFAASLSRDGLAVMGRRYLDQVAPLAAGAARLVDKMPSNFLHAGLIRLILPGARLVHIRRDPADTCFSCYTRLFENGQDYAYDLVELARFHRAYQGLMAHWRRVLPAEAFLEIGYEALVADLEGEARRLVAFCGLPWDAACLRFHETERLVRTGSLNQVRRPLYGSSIGRARRYREFIAPLLDALAAP